MSNLIEQMNLINKIVVLILVQGNDTGKAYEFKGIISDVGNKGIEGKRGLLFVSEVRNQVMVGFEYAEPNRPYVSGSLFNEKTQIRRTRCLRNIIQLSKQMQVSSENEYKLNSKKIIKSVEYVDLQSYKDN